LQIKPIVQISFSFVIVTLGILLVANFFGFVPDEVNARLRSRVQLAEIIAIQISIISKNNNFEYIPEIINAASERNEHVLSAAFRNSGGHLMASNGEHPEYAGDIPSTPEFLRIPVFKNEMEWGEVELRFDPLTPKGHFSFLSMPFVRLLLFVSLMGFLIYLFLIRKILYQLDPSKAVPERVKAAMDALSEGVVLIDKDNRIVFFNNSFANSVGNEMKAVVGMNLSKFPWDSSYEESVRSLPWDDTLENGGVYTHITIKLMLPNNSDHVFVVNSTPIKDNGGEIRGVLISFNDVTELKKKNIELKKKRKAEKNRIQWLESMAVFLRHELRTPLIGASTSMMLLEKSHDLNEDEQQLVDRTKKSHDVIKELLDSITEATNAESTFLKEKIEPIRIDTLFEELVENYNSIYSDQDFIYESDGVEIVAQGKEERFIQMLDKLVNNAIDFCKKDTPIIISCKKRKKDVVVKVINDGAALPEDKLGLFDLFSSCREESRLSNNRGIGLYVVKLIAEGYGGEVEAKDREDEVGAEFVIKLPIV